MFYFNNNKNTETYIDFFLGYSQDDDSKKPPKYLREQGHTVQRTRYELPHADMRGRT